MTADTEIPVPPSAVLLDRQALTNRERRRFIYGAVAERPDTLAPLEERIQAGLDLADRLLAGMRELGT